MTKRLASRTLGVRSNPPRSKDNEHGIRDAHPYGGLQAHATARRRHRAAAPKLRQWAASPITFDCKDHPASIHHEGLAALILDPIIDGFHLTKVLMDDGSSLNLLYQDTVRKMGIDHSRIRPATTIFKGTISSIEANCMGSITLEVVFGSPNKLSKQRLDLRYCPAPQ